MRPLVLSRAREQAVTQPLPDRRGSAQTRLALSKQDQRRSHPNENRYNYALQLPKAALVGLS